MNVLTEIVTLLADEKESLTNGLYKLKLLATRIKNVELLTWVNRELNGYDDEKDLPVYRKTAGLLKGTFSNGYRNLVNQTIPTFNFPPELVNFTSNWPILQNISIVEDFANRAEDSLPMAVPAELSAFMMKFIKEYNPTAIGYSLHNVHLLISTVAYKNVLMNVRNYALDLALALESELGYEIEIGEIIRKKDETNQIIHNYMTQNNITNIGDGNLVNAGDNNTVSQNTIIQKGNFDQLRQALSQVGLDNEDIDELEEVLKEDNTDADKKQFGDGTKGWIKKMVDKYFDAGTQIGFGAIGSTIANLLSTFLGF